MSKFRKKPVVVEAVRISNTDFNAALLPSAVAFDGPPFDLGDETEFPGWLVDAVGAGVLAPHSRGGTDYAQWDITTLEGVVTAQPGDWIVRGVEGELYPCRNDIFAPTHERVDLQAPTPANSTEGKRP